MAPPHRKPSTRKTRRGKRKKRERESATNTRTTETGSTAETLTSVINLSPIDLTPAQTQVLSKGLSFAPTYRTNHFQTKIELFRFYRNLHLKAWYAQQPQIAQTTQTLQSGFKPKSTFCPLSNNSLAQ